MRVKKRRIDGLSMWRFCEKKIRCVLECGVYCVLGYL